MKSAISLAAAALLVASSFQGQDKNAPEKDTVKRVEGADIKGKVTRASYLQVVITEGSKTHTLKASDVTDILFGDTPGAYAGARRAWDEQKPDKAANLFEDAWKEIETKKLRDMIKAPVLYHWGWFLAERGKVDEGLEKLKKLRAECGDTWWRPDAYRKAIELSKGKGPEAQKAVLDEMRAEPEPLGSEGEMGLAELAMAQNQHDEALAVYSRVADKPGSAYAEAGKLGIFRTLKLLKRTTDLEAYCQKLMADASAPPSLQQAAGAWAAGVALEKAGKDKAKIRAAIISAGKAIAMGPPERKDAAEDYVAALRVAAKGYTTLAGEAAKPEQKQEYKSRASGYLMEIVRAYKGTPWAEAAQLELQTLGVSEN